MPSTCAFLNCGKTKPGKREPYLCPAHEDCEIFTCTVESPDESVLQKKKTIKKIAAENSAHLHAAVRKLCVGRGELVIQVFVESLGEFMEFDDLDILDD